MEVVGNSIVCPICGKQKDKSFRRINGVWHCDRHYRQLLKYGEIKNTHMDLNKIVKQGEHILIHVGKDVYAKIDSEDHNKVRDIRWRYNGEYVVSTIQKDKGKRLYLQNVVLNIEPSEGTIDHIDRDKLNNTKENLRIVDKSKNMMNSKLSKRNSSGVKGVTYDSTRNKWMAYICKDGKSMNLGRYNTKQEAIVKRLEYEATLFGIYSYYYNKECNAILFNDEDVQVLIPIT